MLWLCPHVPTGSVPVLARAAQSVPQRGLLQGMQGLHSSIGYATNHTQTKSHGDNAEEEACSEH